MVKRKHKNAVVCTILCVCCLCTACGKKAQEKPIEVVQAYDYGIALPEVHKSAENVAVQYANYLREGWYDAAFSLISLPDNAYYTKEDMLSVESSLTDLRENYILYSVKQSGNTVKLTYGNKIGEAYSKVKRNTPAEYLGEAIQGTLTVDVPVVQLSDGAYAVDVREAYFTDEQIALHVPDGVSVWFGGTLLDATQRDSDGCYILSDFIASGVTHVKLTSAVEENEIVLVLDADSDEVKEMSAVDNELVYPEAELYKGIRRWNYKWIAGRETQASALEYTKAVLQNLYTAAETQTDFYDSTVSSQFIDAATAESVKAPYMQLSNAFVDTKTKDYRDLTCISVNLAPDDFMQKKGYTNEIINGGILRLYVETEYSYVTYSVTADSTTPHTGTSKGYVYLTRNTDGEWRLAGFDTSVLKTVR